MRASAKVTAYSEFLARLS